MKLFEWPLVREAQYKHSPFDEDDDDDDDDDRYFIGPHGEIQGPSSLQTTHISYTCSLNRTLKKRSA